MESEQAPTAPVNPWPGPAGINAASPLPIPGARYQRYLERRGSTLRFDAALESAYLQHRIRNGLPLLRVSLAFALAFYFSYLGLDWLWWRRFDQAFVYVLLLGVAAPSVAVLLLGTWASGATRWLPQATRAVLVVNASALVTALTLAQYRGITIPSQVLIVHLLYDFFLTGMLFRWALTVAAGTVLAYALAASWSGMAPAALFDTLYFLGGTVLLGGIACFVDERTDRRAWLQSKLLEELAQRDSLTGLFNRRSFHERATGTLAHARREGKPVALLLVDADHFKALNDQHGHLAGDKSLSCIAAILGSVARRPLDVAGRLGGEEFALLLYDTDLHWAMHCAQALRHAVARTAVAYDGGSLNLTVSIGLAVHHDDVAVRVDDLIGRADRGLYQAKAAGRNRVCVNA